MFIDLVAGIVLVLCCNREQSELKNKTAYNCINSLPCIIKYFLLDCKLCLSILFYIWLPTE